MSAMGAAELPEVPASGSAAAPAGQLRSLATAAPRDTAASRAAARWTRPGQTLTAFRPAQPPHATTEPGRAARTAIRPGPSSLPLRLTRRGRVVAGAAAALLLTALLLIASGAAQATSHSAPGGAAQQNRTRVLVRPGQSLWSVAESADPGADTRQVIQQIIELNGLSGDVVTAGQQLWVPRG
jgi:LysM domain